MKYGAHLNPSEIDLHQKKYNNGSDSDLSSFYNDSHDQSDLSSIND
jgi:hypothetical protein